MAAATQQKDQGVRVYQHGAHILVAQLCRPRTRNAFDEGVYAQLIDAIEAYEADAALHALVITGHGDFFTSGMDVMSTIHTMNPRGPDAELPSKGIAPRFMHTMLRCRKLIVAAVNGRAIGIGVTLLMHCDIVFAADSAKFWTPFMRIGIVPEFASSYTFPTILGPMVANDLLLRSKEIGIERAVACGLVSEVFPAGPGFLQRVFDEIEPLVAEPVAAKTLSLFKSVIRRVREPLVREALVAEYVELDRRFLSGETYAAASKTIAELAAKKQSKKSKI
ncbi:hypothetical protein PybrP1_002692 [[Pythium] brassicae (nom. inval.)]|nr:hypothetical protein PybrP1_002692 [[Pythium] brassicae (nom. inval.)]